MYAKNFEPEKALYELGLAVHGGVTENDDMVEGLPLSYELRTIEIYSTYGLTLARQNRCSEAIPIFQAMLTIVPDDEIAVFNAEAGLELCQENLEAVDEEAEDG